MNKLTRLFKSDVVLKYQLVPEELDALVSVICDEDVRNMFDEFDFHSAMRSSNGRSPRMRAFLFPFIPVTIESQFSISNTGGVDSDGVLEQCYIEAINGIARTTSDLGPSIYSISSSGSSHCSSNSGGDVSDAPWQHRPRPELQRVYSFPNVLGSGKQYSQHSRFRRSGPRLMTCQSDVARYNFEQLARRYCTPVKHLNVNRSGWLGEGELMLQSRMKQRWGSPLKFSSNSQD